MIRNEKAPTLDDVLNEFVAEYERPTSEALEMWVGRYPQFRRELIDFVEARAEQTVLPEASARTADEEERIVDRAMSHALNVSFKRDAESHPVQSCEKAITSLTGEAKNAGMNVAEFAKGCGLDLALVAKLNNRQILPETIPRRLVSHIARLVGRTAEGVRAYLKGPPQLLSGLSFKSKTKPRGSNGKASPMPCAPRRSARQRRFGGWTKPPGMRGTSPWRDLISSGTARAFVTRKCVRKQAEP